MGLQHLLIAETPDLDPHFKEEFHLVVADLRLVVESTPILDSPVCHAKVNKTSTVASRGDVKGRLESTNINRAVHTCCQSQPPEVMETREVSVMALSIIAADSNSTAVSLAAIFYYFLKNPKTLLQAYRRS